MATQKNAIVTKIEAGTVIRQNEYLGCTRYIPVDLTGDYADADVLEFSAGKMPDNCYLIGIHLTNTAMGGTASIDVGVTGDPDSIIDGASVVNAGTVNYQGVAVDVSGKQIVGTVVTNWDDGAITGYILVVTDQ